MDKKADLDPDDRSKGSGEPEMKKGKKDEGVEKKDSDDLEKVKKDEIKKKKRARPKSTVTRVIKNHSKGKEADKVGF